MKAKSVKHVLGFDRTLELLQEQLEVKEPKEAKKSKTPETTLKQQILILHYLGLIKQLPIDSTKDKAQLLAVLLNRSSQNIKETLTYLHKKAELYDIKTKNNLTFVYDFFTQLGLNDIAQDVKNELDKLKAKKE